MRTLNPIRTRYAVLLFFVLTLRFYSNAQEVHGSSAPELELSRPVRSWEFLSATGPRAALFGNEAGVFEAWVYPLKILRDFHLRFHLQGAVFPAESLARTITVHPESASILYAGDTFTVRETIFVPVHEAGAVIQLEVDAAEPVEIEAEFQRDFQLEWPGAITGAYSYWDQNLRAFVFADELQKFAAVVGSPSAERASEEFWTSNAASKQNSFRLGFTKEGREAKLIVIAASVKDSTEAEVTYHRLSATHIALLKESSDYYQTFLDHTLKISVPDEQLQAAYDWARISMLQGLVENPFLGAGLVAGYRTSGDSQRPGFAWFFGRDALWTSLGVDAAGDYATTRTALDFLRKYQRDDGKIPHEVSQSASLTPWFKDYPYAYASADATPLFIIVMNDYVTRSGDVNYAKDNWPSIWKAFEFLSSTFDSQGFSQNLGFGHGWVEGGPLLPVKTELYQSSLGLEALRALANLAELVGRNDLSETLKHQFETQQPLLNNAFWASQKNTFGYALGKDDKVLDTTSVLATVPMWFGLLDKSKAEATIDHLADTDHQTDWGMRIVSSHDPRYSPGGYHNGSVWPLFTGWAATGEYRYHRALPAFSNLRSNALLTFEGALGHITEVVSGDYNQPTLGSSPHQIWSAAMVVNPLLRGLFGLEVNGIRRSFVLAPHVPANWKSFQIGNLRVGSAVLNLDYARMAESIVLELQHTGTGDCQLEFSPAISLRAEVVGAEIDGHAVAFHVEANSEDQHVTVRVPIAKGQSQLRIHLRNDFGLSLSEDLPPLGDSSRGLHVISSTWTPKRDQMILEVSGVTGREYYLGVLNPDQVASVDGGQLMTDENGRPSVRVRLHSERQSLRIIFRSKNRKVLAP